MLARVASYSFRGESLTTAARPAQGTGGTRLVPRPHRAPHRPPSPKRAPRGATDDAVDVLAKICHARLPPCGPAEAAGFDFVASHPTGGDPQGLGRFSPGGGFSAA